ncbi:MAG: tRNA pseudouridine(38-40) synthase TruA [Clostridia bacterium]|nr:tRNA pseudouridine(38-40) synthase TruA [Clostridia bacterium]
MKRILLTVEYDGTGYAGWQRQITGLAVQQVLEETLEKACGHPVTVTGASRTDAGVHALGQMVHFDTNCTIPPDKFPFVLNNLLPPDIRVHAGREVPAGFHARFLSAGKTYTYRIINSRHGSAIYRNTFVHVPVPLSSAPMLEAVAALPGTHDFAAFQASGGTARTTVRTLYEANLSFCEASRQIILTVHGNAFLYNMVRIIAGTLIEVGLGKRGPDAFDRAFRSLSRLDLGMTAPAHGLELTRVHYDPEAFINPAALRWHNEEAQPCSD